MQPRIVGLVDYTHAAFAQLGLDTIVPHYSSGGEFGGDRQPHCRRTLQTGFLIRRQQPFHFGAELSIPLAGRLQKSRPVRIRRLKRHSEHLTQPRPSFRCHTYPPALNCNFNHPLAIAQSSFTVRVATPMASAVSSTDNPPK